MGLVPVDNGIANITVPCTVTSITPNTGLNVLGGKNLTIAGSGFPHSIGTNQILITFSDGQQTTCVP